MKLTCLRCYRLHLKRCACGRLSSTLRAKHWNLLRRAVERYNEGIVTCQFDVVRALEERGLVRVFGRPFDGKVKVFARQVGRDLHEARAEDEASRKLLNKMGENK